MTLQQMRYFIGAAESGSISEAAKRSFTAQSSISGAIKEVENTYGITAFVRDSKGVRLTRSGEELLIEFKGILNRLDYLDEKFNGSKDRPLGLSVSSQHHICGMNSFVSIIKSLNTGAGPYHCGFHECRTSEVMDRVERGLDDLGIVFVTEYSKGQMMQYPFITYDRSSDTNPAYTDLIVPYHQLNRVIQVSDRAASYSVMRYCQGFAVGSGYRPFDDNYSDIVSIPIKNGLRLEIGWIVRQKYTLSDTASRFVDLLMQVESVVL